MSVRVLVVDDHAGVRQSMRRALESEPDLEVVGEAADGVSAIQLARELEPDVVIMDIVLPQLNGIEATRRIKENCPNVQVVGISVHRSRGYAARLLEAGARAYVLKDGGMEELLHAISIILKGQSYLSPGVETLDS